MTALEEIEKLDGILWDLLHIKNPTDEDLERIERVCETLADLEEEEYHKKQ